MGLFDVSMVCQMEFEEFVGKDAGLWEAVHTFSDFHVDTTINGLFAYSLMFDEIVGYQLQWHFHVLVSIKRFFKVHILDVGAAKFGVGRTDNAVPHYFQ